MNLHKSSGLLPLNLDGLVTERRDGDMPLQEEHLRNSPTIFSQALPLLDTSCKMSQLFDIDQAKRLIVRVNLNPAFTFQLFHNFGCILGTDV